MARNATLLAEPLERFVATFGGHIMTGHHIIDN